MLKKFLPGETITNFKIIRDEIIDSDSNYHTYLGEWQCCGKIGVLLHKSLLDRIAVGRQFCKKCAYKNRGKGKKKEQKIKSISPPEPPYMVLLPTWPPTSIGLKNVRRK